MHVAVLKGEVYLDGLFFTNFVRIEYRAGRLVERARERLRFVRNELLSQVTLLPTTTTEKLSAAVKLNYCPWIGAFQAEIWGELEPVRGSSHDFQVLQMMGKNAAITRVPHFSKYIADLKCISRMELSFRENDVDYPFGYKISEQNTERDDNYLGTHQEPRKTEPSSFENTIDDKNYAINFQRGWFFPNVTDDVKPVFYRNAMMDESNKARANDNIIEMRWILQRELGSSLVFFHEVTIPPFKTEGSHQHIGSEELYFITEGEGFAYMRVGDDPSTEQYDTVVRDVFGLGEKEFKELPVRPGSVIFTKSGGMHGIRNPSDKPLKFVAFLYHST